tara:strand:- start:6265 stop:6675 length:411 start_codon:yes stop_codon:yes gene_type:complete
MNNLRNKIIRLAHENPELRKDLLPLLKAEKTAEWDGGLYSIPGRNYMMELRVEEIKRFIDRDARDWLPDGDGETLMWNKINWDGSALKLKGNHVYMPFEVPSSDGWKLTGRVRSFWATNPKKCRVGFDFEIDENVK